MRIFTILLALCFYTFGQAQITLPIDFESTTIMYTFGDFDGGVMTVIDNPDQSGINTSAKVAQMVKNAGAVFAGSSILLDGPIDFSTNKLFKMKVWVPNDGDKVLLKVENSGDPGINFEKEVTVGTGGSWQEVEFDYSTINTANSYDKIVLIFDLGTEGDGGANFTYFLDDIELVMGVSVNRPELPIDFESTTVDYVFGDFDGGVMTLIDNPDQSGINMSAKVAQMVKGAGPVFAGSSITLDGPIDFSTNKLFKMKVWVPNDGDKVLLKVENSSDPGINFEKEVTVATAGSWQEVEFDYSTINTANSYDKIVLIFDLGTEGDGGADFTYFLDDIELVMGASSNLPALPIDFESTTVDYVFGDFDGGAMTLIDNPDQSGINTSAKVAQMVKNAGAVFAGSSILLDGPIDFSQNKLFRMKVWVPNTGDRVLLKVENSGSPGVNFEVEDTTTTSGAWEMLEFDYSNINTAESYDKIVLIFELGTEGDGGPDFTYYLDDISLGGVTSVKTLSAADYGIKVAPNPANTFFQLEIPESINGEMEYSLFDISGKLLEQRPVQGKMSQINTADLNPGTYFLNLRTQDAIYVQKVMIIK